ncbi:hypothetical protein J1N35_029374 [Gossypium stocksii]|uniref:Uncharacterized protein n=1 Tax=Gossypium stocksii TaxID=47602 RepID=A0A9D3ZT90_9ROSI|nr:hypothetical protein J1N35_029374 [Gossypium stocksii]
MMLHLFISKMCLFRALTQNEVETVGINEGPSSVSDSMQHDEPVFAIEDFPAIVSSRTQHDVPTNVLPMKSFLYMGHALDENNALFKLPGIKPVGIALKNRRMLMEHLVI